MHIYNLPIIDVLYSKGGHNVDVHQLTKPLKSNVHTGYLALVKDGKQHGNHQANNTIPPWILRASLHLRH